jgi:rhamnose utilization protein RhaD (predicted bifunctional aldolase and dehydrogenase)
MKEISQLIEISRYYGNNPDFVLGGGGNTSFKNESTIWVKASGRNLASITENDFVELDRNKLKLAGKKKFSANSEKREAQIQDFIQSASISKKKRLRPSVETSLHNIVEYQFVVHSHPFVVNGVLCSQNAKTTVYECFGNNVLFVPYANPGYLLFKQVKKGLADYRKKFKLEPKIIFLQSHGVIVAANDIDEIKSIYAEIISTIGCRINKMPEIRELPVDEQLMRIACAIKTELYGNQEKTILINNNLLIQQFYSSREQFNQISLPVSPDAIIYYNACPVMIEQTKNLDQAIEEFRERYNVYKALYSEVPKIMVVKNLGFVAIDGSPDSAKTAVAVFENVLKISILSAFFGGPRFLYEQNVAYLQTTDIVNYRKSMSNKEKEDL